MKKYIITITLITLIGLLVATRNDNYKDQDARPIDVTQSKVVLVTDESNYDCLVVTQLKDVWGKSGEARSSVDKTSCYKN